MVLFSSGIHGYLSWVHQSGLPNPMVINCSGFTVQMHFVLECKLVLIITKRYSVASIMETTPTNHNSACAKRRPVSVVGCLMSVVQYYYYLINLSNSF